MARSPHLRSACVPLDLAAAMGLPRNVVAQSGLSSRKTAARRWFICTFEVFLFLQQHSCGVRSLPPGPAAASFYLQMSDAASGQSVRSPSFSLNRRPTQPLCRFILTPVFQLRQSHPYPPPTFLSKSRPRPLLLPHIKPPSRRLFSLYRTTTH